MGKAAKTRRSEKRKSDKRAAKAQQQSLYDSYKKAGSNRKKKGDSAGNRGVATAKHATVNCGNVGCKRCFPDLAAPRMNAAHSRLAPAVKRKKAKPVLGAMLARDQEWMLGKTVEEIESVHANLGLSPTEEAFFAKL